MDVRTIEISQDEALTKLALYRGLNRKQIQPEDDRLAQLYRMVAKGGRVLDVNEAFRATGLKDDDFPKLAMARADWQDVFFAHQGGGAGMFRGVNEMWRSNRVSVTVPPGTFDAPTNRGRWDVRFAHVPHVPPSMRPRIAMSNFHILFEVDEWKEPQQSPRYSRDPFLLRRIQGSLYVVVAEWDLTELEASLLGAIRNGN